MKVWRITTVVLAIASWAVAAPPSANLPAALADTKAKLARGETADIVVLGDSLSFRPGSYLPYFREHMQQQYGNAGAGYQGFSLWTGVGFDAGWLTTPTIGNDVSPHHSLDGLWNRHDSVTGFPNRGYVAPVDSRVQLQYVRQPGGGAFQIRRGFDGPVVETIHTDSTIVTTDSATSVDPTPNLHHGRTLGFFDYALEGTETLYTVAPITDGRPVTILGQNNLRDNPGVRIHRAANGGWGVNNFLRRDTTFDQQLASLSTDLVMVWIGQNDQGFDRPSYAAHIDKLVTRLRLAVPQSEIVLIGTYDQGATPLAALVEGMHDVAASRGVGFINLYATAGDAAFFNSQGYLDDGVHFSPAGGEYVGQFLFDAFLTDGASLPARSVPESAAMFGVVALLAMIRR